jgi:hypothetical protein
MNVSHYSGLGLEIATGGIAISDFSTIDNGLSVVDGITVISSGLVSGGLLEVKAGAMTSSALDIDSGGLEVITGGLTIGTAAFSSGAHVMLMEDVPNVNSTRGVLLNVPGASNSSFSFQGGSALETESLFVDYEAFYVGSCCKNVITYDVNGTAISTPPTRPYRVGVHGDVNCTNDLVQLTPGGFTSNYSVLNDAGVAYFEQLSDERLKTNLQPLGDSIKILTGMRGVYYDWIKDQEADEANYVRQVGLIAQDVRKVFPEATKASDDKDGFLGVDYAQIVPLLVDAINKLDRRSRVSSGRSSKTSSLLAALDKIRAADHDLVLENISLEKRIERLEHSFM